MNPDGWHWLCPVVALGAALVFLLVGWRLGRESAGRPMFDYPLIAVPPCEAVEEADPWTEAALGRRGGQPVVDIFETLLPPSAAENTGLVCNSLKGQGNTLREQAF